MHYGHPDGWNVHYIRATAGCLSKASAQLNLSEDIFSGMKASYHGYTSRHSNLLSFGKGREELLSRALGFRSKIAGGAGSVMRSRDIHDLTLVSNRFK